MAITITVCLDGPARMQVEVEGDFDAVAAGRVLEAVRACRGIHQVGLDFRAARGVDAEALAGLGQALSAPEMPSVRTRGLPANACGWLRGRGYEPAGLQPAMTVWGVVGKA